MLRTIAQIISVIFHPLLVLTYMLILLILINPYLFGTHSLSGNIPLILYVFFSTFLIPSFAVLIMKQLGFVSSLQMPDRMERTGPYIVTGIFYLWMFRNFLDNPNIPNAYTTFVLGATIGLFLAFFINIFSKISVHAVGMGGLIGMVIISLFLFSYGDFVVRFGDWNMYQVSMNHLLMLILVIAGLVGTARLLIKAHQPTDIYGGYLIGFLAQLVALWFLN